MADGERLAVSKVDLQLPVRLGDEGPPLALALGYEGEGRRLDASYGEKGAPVALGGARDPPGQGGAPDQVYVLPRLTSLGQLLRDFKKLIESPAYLAGGKGREARPLYVVDEPRVCLEDQGERFHADQLSLAVEVRGDDDPARLLGERLDGLGHPLLGDGLQDLGVYELPGLDLLPV